MSDLDELDLVDWLSRTMSSHKHVHHGIGDDMAIVDHAGSPLLLSSDMLLDGIHFDWQKQNPGQIGHKVIACALSDCAAMAVQPTAATISLSLPGDIDKERLFEMFRGLDETARQFDCAIVGGDTTRWRHPLAIDVAICAKPYDGCRPVLRSGAVVGDGIFVTGPLGGSLLGRHLQFKPRIAEAHTLAMDLGQHLHAMLDISDGLSLDLSRLCEASAAGAMLHEQWLKRAVHTDAKQAAEQDNRASLDHALHDGEDFELLLASSSDSTSIPLIRIGEITESGLSIRMENGTTQLLSPKGFVH